VLATSGVLGGQPARWVAVAACLVGTVLAGLRWLRVAQREHYLPDAASRFALRWWGSSPLNVAAVLAAGAGLILAGRWPAAAVVTGVVVGVGPAGLALRGSSAHLAWTRRLRTLALVWALLQLAVAGIGLAVGAGPIVCAGGALAVPAVVDLACLLTTPLERRLAAPYVQRARARLDKVRPRVVAVTGSYGKTSTKGYIAHLAGGTLAVVASPASFNNRAGLARAVNEQLADGTELFVAEMGTYGKGEIAELCRWLPPEVAVITAIGPVHLERFRTEDAIVEAKAEILAGARCAVLVVDDERLAALAERTEAAGTRVRRVSARPGGGDVCALATERGVSIVADGETVASDVHLDGRPGNVAAAVAVALELGVAKADIAPRLATLPGAPHRLERIVAPSGCVVLDDTYNANPAGAQVALEALAAEDGRGGRRVVVTPGMVELGARQDYENERFAGEAAAVASELVVVGRTNRRTLERGWTRSEGLHWAPTRDAAVAWVRAELGEGDAVLYENDLPDHYP
jgi:UDP-N-acetylmuramoyl-tripeptide--D-alanyl-D-alanine ligase